MNTEKQTQTRVASTHSDVGRRCRTSLVGAEEHTPSHR